MEKLVPYMYLDPRIYQNTKFHANNKFFNLGPEIPYLGIFRHKCEKKFAIFEISTLEFIAMQRFVQNKRLKIFDQKCLIWIFLGGNFNILKLTLANFSKCKVSGNKKTLNLGPKITYEDVFRLHF